MRCVSASFAFCATAGSGIGLVHCSCSRSAREGKDEWAGKCRMSVVSYVCGGTKVKVVGEWEWGWEGFG